MVYSLQVNPKGLILTPDVRVLIQKTESLILGVVAVEGFGVGIGPLNRTFIPVLVLIL